MDNPEAVRKIRRLFWDIEVSPNVVYSWGIGRKISLSHENIVAERKIICICWKWEGETKVYSASWDEKHDDKSPIKEFLAVAEQADELVHQFGDDFDLPWVRTRCVIHGLDPIPEFKTRDTKHIAANNFYFNSNKLDYLGEVLGYGRKLKTEFELWINVMRGVKSALDYMVRYCKMDVVRLEQVFHRLNPYVEQETHVGVLAGHGRWTCPACGSANVKVSKRRVSKTGIVSWQMKCLDCGTYFKVNNSVYESYKKQKCKS